MPKRNIVARREQRYQLQLAQEALKHQNKEFIAHSRMILKPSWQTTVVTSLMLTTMFFAYADGFEEIPAARKSNNRVRTDGKLGRRMGNKETIFGAPHTNTTTCAPISSPVVHQQVPMQSPMVPMSALQAKDLISPPKLQENTQENTYAQILEKTAQEIYSELEDELGHLSQFHLSKAIAEDNVELFNTTIHQMPSLLVEGWDADKLLPIHVVASNGRMKIMRYLLDEAPVKTMTMESDRGADALTYACAAGEKEMVNLLVRRGALNFHYQSFNKNCFIQAAIANQTEILNFLRSLSFNLDDSINPSPTFQVLVKLKNPLLALKNLLASGANPNRTEIAAPEDEVSMTSILSSKHHLSLLEYCTCFNLKNETEVLLQYGADMYHRTERGHFLIDFALLKGYYPIVDAFLRHHYDIYKVSRRSYYGVIDGIQPLYDSGRWVGDAYHHDVDFIDFLALIKKAYPKIFQGFSQYSAVTAHIALLALARIAPSQTVMALALPIPLLIMFGFACVYFNRHVFRKISQPRRNLIQLSTEGELKKTQKPKLLVKTKPTQDLVVQEIKSDAKEKETPKTIAVHCATFASLIQKIKGIIADFDKANPDCEHLIASFAKDDLPSRQIKTAYSACKGLMSQHETNKKWYEKLKMKHTLTPDALVTPENLRTINKLIEEATLLHTEINNTITAFNSQKENVMLAIQDYNNQDKREKKSNKNAGKTAAILAALKHKKDEKEQEKDHAPQKPKETKEKPKRETKAPNKPSSTQEPRKQKPVALRTDRADSSKSTHGTHNRQRKLKILGGAVHHLLCIGILATDYIDLLEEKVEEKSEKQAQKDQHLETLHFALLYNISRCFQALKIYKQRAQSSLEQISQELLEDLRNMIVKLGALDADKGLVLETAKKLTQFLPRSLCEMRKTYLTTPVLERTQINDLVNVFGLVNDPKRFELEAYPIPLDELPLYQQLASCHENKKESTLTPLEFETKIWVKAIPLIKKIMASLSKVHPVAPLKLTDNKFNEYFWREIQALKMLLSSCGTPYSEAECRQRIGMARKAHAALKDSTQATIKFYEFLAFCREHITNQVGHAFEDDSEFLNYDVTVVKIYQACYKAAALTDKPFFGDLSAFIPKEEKEKPKRALTALVVRGSEVYSGVTGLSGNQRITSGGPVITPHPQQSPHLS